MITRLALVASLLLAIGCEKNTDAPDTSSRASTKAFKVALYKDPKPVDDFRVTTLDGRTLTTADLRGKVVIVNFWATWCRPCRQEIPDLVELQAKYAGDLIILGISEDEAPVERVKAFAAEHKVNYPIVMTNPALQKVFPGVTALPTTFILDKEGRLAQKHVGMLDPERTEHETLALAGLAPNAKIEWIEPEKPQGLENAAQAKEIPGVDLTKLTPEKRVAVLERLNAEPCSCGCGLTVARCRVDDPACGVSLPLARKLAAEIASQ